MLYLSEKSFWRSVLLIVVFYLKLCKPRRGDPGSGEPGYPNPANQAPKGGGGGYMDWTVTPRPATTTTLPTGPDGLPIPGADQTTPISAAAAAAGAQQNRFTTKTTTKKKLIRTTPERISFEEKCDYLAHYCLKAYDTGKLCGRTIYYGYYTFRNYCMLDYVNCRERFEVWQVVHMGACYEIKVLTEYLLYPYDDDYFLDQYYILEDHK